MFSFAGPSCLSTIHSQAQSNGIDYPFAVASINVTQHLARQFLAGWFKNESAMNRNIYRNCWGRIQKLTCIPCAIPLYSKDLGLGSVQCLGFKVLQSSKCMQMHYERHVVGEILLKVKWFKQVVIVCFILLWLCNPGVASVLAYSNDHVQEPHGLKHEAKNITLTELFLRRYLHLVKDAFGCLLVSFGGFTVKLYYQNTRSYVYCYKHMFIHAYLKSHPSVSGDHPFERLYGSSYTSCSASFRWVRSAGTLWCWNVLKIMEAELG